MGDDRGEEEEDEDEAEDEEDEEGGEEDEDEGEEEEEEGGEEEEELPSSGKRLRGIRTRASATLGAEDDGDEDLARFSGVAATRARRFPARGESALSSSRGNSTLTARSSSSLRTVSSSLSLAAAASLSKRRKSRRVRSLLLA